MFRRIIGYILLAVGILGVVLSVVGIIFGSQVIDGVGTATKSTLALASDGLVTTKGALEETKGSVQEVSSTVSNVQSAVLNTSETVNQADAFAKQVIQIVSQDVPKAIDDVHATIPATAQVAKTLLSDVETAMVNAGETATQTGPLVNQLLKISSGPVPDTIDQVHATIPSTLQVTRNLLNNVETTMVDASQTINQTDAALNQIIQIASQDVPNAIDNVHATIPPVAEATQSLLSTVQGSLVNASQTVDLSSAALDQVVSIASQDVPDTIDAVYATIPPTAAMTQDLLGNVQMTMVDASKTVDTADAAMDQIVTIASRNIPDVIDGVHATIPATANVTKGLLGSVEATMVDASETVKQTDAALDQIIKIASQDLPDAFDQANATIIPVAEATQGFLGNVETTLANTRGAVQQTDQALAQTSKIVSGEVPDTIDQVNRIIPFVFDTTEGNVNTTLALLRELNYLDRNYKVQMTDTSNELSSRLDRLSTQLRGMDELLDTNLKTVDQGVATMSRDVTAINRQLDDLVGTLKTLDQVSTQFRALEAVSDNNLDVVSDDILMLSGDVNNINNQIDELVKAANQLEVVSNQLRALEVARNNGLGAVSQDILAMSGNVGTISNQIGAIVAAAGQLENVSQQLRGLEAISNNNLGTVSQDILALSENVAAINSQVDQVVAVSDNLATISNQLRQLQAISDNNLSGISDDILALSDNVAAVNEQLDQYVVAADSLQALATQLRTLEPYANVDFSKVGQDVVTLSKDIAAINQQVDQVVAVADNLTVLSNQLRALEAFSDNNLSAVSQDIVAISDNVGTINQHVDGIVASVDEYIALVENVKLNIDQTQANLDSQLSLAKTVIFIAMIWILLAQLAPLYLGWELASGQRDGSQPAA